MKPWLLDLFCCAGGATRGYQRAGFNVHGVDRTSHSSYSSCAHPTIIALWQPWCRTCDATLDPMDLYGLTIHSFLRPFRRTKRPAGKGNK